MKIVETSKGILTIPGKAEYKSDLVKIQTILQAIDKGNLDIINHIIECETLPGEMIIKSIKNLFYKQS